MGRTSKALKIFLFAVGGLAGLGLLAALAVFFFVDVNTYKPRVEAAASEALGMDVTIEGRLRVKRFIPGLQVALEKVRIRNHGAEIVFVDEVELSMELLLFQRKLRYESLTLNRARLFIERGQDGRYNYEKPPEPKETLRALNFKKLSFSELVVIYADRQSGSGFESRNCNGELTDIRHPGGATFLKRLSLSGQFACSELRGKNTTVSDLEFSVAAKEGVFDFKPVTMHVFGGQGAGSVRIDLGAEVPVVDVSYSLSKFRIEQFFKEQPPDRSVSGVMDFSATLSLRGQTGAGLRGSAQGEMSLSGTNLTLAGRDIDNRLSKYESSQSFNLFDAAALVFTGPMGLVVTKGVQFSSVALALQGGGTTEIRSVVSKWRIEKGVAHAKDVAMVTRKNRLALQGGLDFVNEEYDDMIVAMVDSNGCARVRQRIRGTFSKPVMERPSVMTSLSGPVVNLLSDTWKHLPGTGIGCKVFYDGSLAPPKE